VTGYAITRDSSNNFIANVSVTWSLANITGGVVSGDLVAAGDGKSATFTGHLVGSANMHAVLASPSLSADSGKLTVVPGAAAKLQIETMADGSGTVVPAQDVTAGNTVTGYAITRDSSNNFVANVSVTWSLANVTGGVVSGDLVAAGDGKSATFTGHLVGSANMHAVLASPSLSADSGKLTVVPGTASKLAFTTSGQTLVVGQCSAQITVQSQDSSGNPSVLSTSVQVNLSILSGGTGGFFSDSGCTSAITFVTIPTSGSTASFYFKGTTVGSPTTIKAADNANVLAAAMQDETVNKADTTTTVTRITGPSPSVYGQPLTFQAAVTVNSPGSGSPTGNVTFYNGGTCMSPGTTLQAATALDGSGHVTFSTSTLAASATAYTILACYAGDTNFKGSGGSIQQTVNKADTTTMVTSSPTVTFGATSVTLSASVTANSPSTATVNEGTVTFTIKNSTGATTIDTVSGVAVSGGSASTSYNITTPILYAAGAYRIYADYVPAGSNPNFNSSSSLPNYGTLTINPATAVASVTVTPIYYNGGAIPTSGPGPTATYPAPGDCSGITGPCQQYSDEVNFTVTVSPGSVNMVPPLDPVNTCVVANDNVPCVNIKVVGGNALQGFKVYGPIALTLDLGTGNLVGHLDSQQILQMPGPYTATVSPISTVNPNFVLDTNTGRGSLTVVQEDAQIIYTSAQYFSSTSSTMSIQVSFNLQDATATGTGSSIYDPWAGDITKATVSLGLQDVNSPTPIDTAECQSLSITATPGAVDPANGLPSTGSVTCTFDNVPVGHTYTLTASAGNRSYYIFSAGDTAVAITTATGGTGFITGGGFQTAKYLNTAGASGSNKYMAAGLLTPAAGTKVNFGFEGKYQKKNSNLQGGVNIIIRSACVAAGIGGTNYVPHPSGNLCVYQIKVPQGQLTSLSETLTPAPPWAEIAGGANIYDITWPDNIQQVANSKTATLQIQMYDVGDPGPGANVDPLSIQITDSNVGLWFSNNWTGSSTVISVMGVTNPTATSMTAPLIEGGDLQVH
jgi:Bacterial Ig-like domain (group 3)